MTTTSATTEDRVAPERRTFRVDRGVGGRAVAILVFLLVAMFVLPAVTGSDWVKTYTSVAIYAVVAAGLGVLYGRVGMISLGQIGLLAIGTWTATRLNYEFNLPFPVLLLVTGAITCMIGVLVGLPALRLSGLYLALITLMFAGAVNIILTAINFPNGGGGFTGHTAIPGINGLAPVRRPAGAGGDTAYYRYVVVVSALMFLLALIHLAAKPGRAWTSIRESEPAALAAGVNITLYKLWAFALASFMTGVAGGLLASSAGGLTTYAFPTQDSITLIAVTLMGGVFSFWGPIVAALLLKLLPEILKNFGLPPDLLTILFGLGVLQVMMTAPAGLAVQVPKDLANLSRLVRSRLGGGAAG